jgi:hypothetical protein
LFAASQDQSIDATVCAEWLLADDAWWLWSRDLHREVMRLLALRGRHLGEAAHARLEEAILRGPLRNQYRDDLEPESWQHLIDHSVWLRLAKLEASGLALSPQATEHLNELRTANPGWRFEPHEREEFLHWMSGTHDPDYEDSRDVDIAPRKRADLVQWLKRPPPERRPFYEDTSREICRTRFFHSFLAFCDLAQEGLWPSKRWREALQSWSEESRILRSWRYAAPLVQNMPDAVMLETAHSVTRWIDAASNSIDSHEAILLDLCRRVLALPIKPSIGIRQNGEPIN